MNNKSNIWFMSDPHYNHKNIVRGTSDWENPGNKVRDFDTLEEHNKTIVDNINSLVKPDDIMYCLGDWSFGGKQAIAEFAQKLDCRNIHLIFGNHDQHIEPINSNFRVLFKSCDYYKEVSAKGYRFILSHYAMRVWNKSHHGSIMLYGHSHGTLDEMTPSIANPTWIGDQYFIKNYRTMDVGMDTNNLFPYHIDEIIDIMKQREVALEVDHHNSKTN